jgi:hypothetical protein
MKVMPHTIHFFFPEIRCISSFINSLLAFKPHP